MEGGPWPNGSPPNRGFPILENIFKGFVQWIYSLCLEMVQYIANSLLTVFSMDLDLFFQVAPVAKDILSILIAAGWALLMGNLVFQAVRSMVSGLGFEGEDPKLLFTRTFVFAFLLLASQQSVRSAEYFRSDHTNAPDTKQCYRDHSG